MLDATQSGCINHPGVEAAHRCKQCGKPVCNRCVVDGPTGRFCADACKQKHEAFATHAQQLEGRARRPVFVRIRSALGALLVVAAVLVVLGVVGSLFHVPVLSELTWMVRNAIGI